MRALLSLNALSFSPSRPAHRTSHLTHRTFTQLTSNGFSFSPHSFRLLPQIFENEAHDDYFCCGGGKRECVDDAGWDGVRPKQRVHGWMRESHLRARLRSIALSLRTAYAHHHTFSHSSPPPPPSSFSRLCASFSFLFSPHVSPSTHTRIFNDDDTATMLECSSCRPTHCSTRSATALKSKSVERESFCDDRGARAWRCAVALALRVGLTLFTQAGPRTLRWR